MIVTHMQEAISEILECIHHHPFNLELAKGTLPQATFVFYLIQDALYLAEFSRALSLTAARLPSNSHSQQFSRFALDAIQAERQLHSEYLHKYQENEVESEQSPACFMYVNYLLRTANLASVEEAAASLLPCFLIYNEVGKKMLSHNHSAHPYHDWIALYAGAEFEASVNAAIDIVNDLGQQASTGTAEKMVKAFVRASELEWAFWESAYNKTDWKRFQ